MSFHHRFITVLLCLMLPLAAGAKTTPNSNLTILADRGLVMVLSELARNYSTKTNTPLTVIRSMDGDPAQQLEQGFEAHILLSADPTLIERLAQRGLIDVFGTQSFASTQLALVAPYRMKAKLGIAQRISFAALLFSQPGLPIYVNDATSVGGLRAQALMVGREFSHELASRAKVKHTVDEVVEALNREDGFALILASNAVAEPQLTILNLLPESTSDPVRYDAVVLASETMDQARGFTKFLRSKEAQEILKRYGFQPIPDEN